jgi:histone H3/H4
MVGFAKARVERLIRESGAKRVSAKAINCLNEVLTDKASDLAKKAISIARHSGRKTVKERDIRLAAEY